MTDVEHKIDIKRWNAAWNCVSALYSIELTPIGFDGSKISQSIPDADSNPVFQQKSDEQEKAQHE
jgi:hypothetical protein